MNSAILSGVVASTPEIRYTSDAKAIASFNLEFSNPSKSQSAKVIKAVGFGKIAESMAQIAEGDRVILVGAVNITSTKDDTGWNTLIEFKVNSFELVSGQINIINIAGRTGKDTEVRYFESGACKAENSLAVRRTKEQRDWFNLEFWDKTAEVAGNYVRKGGLIAVSGQLKFEEWTDRGTGELRSKPVVNVQQLDLLGSKQQEEERF
jgi:single-strand DNA-binding protein